MNSTSGNQERRARIETKARHYARSGDHLDFTTIEALLIIDGYPEARKLFANLWIQEELNRICQQACNCELKPVWDNRLLKLAHRVSN